MKNVKSSSGYIKEQDTKEKFFKQIDLYKKKFGNDRVDVLITTHSCRCMSVANYKKKKMMK